MPSLLPVEMSGNVLLVAQLEKVWEPTLRVPRRLLVCTTQKAVRLTHEIHSYHVVGCDNAEVRGRYPGCTVLEKLQGSTCIFKQRNV